MFNRPRIAKHLILEDPHAPKPRPGFPLFRIMLLIFASFLAIGFIETARATSTDQRENHSEVSPLNAKAGQLLMQNPGNHYQQALHLGSHIKLAVNGMIVSAALTQEFRNDSADWQEGLYVFPLPEKAAVSHMEIMLGDRQILAKIKEKQQAKKIYQAAKKAGKKAVLIEQQRPNLFTQKVANIAPGETIKVILHYQHAAHYDMGEFSLRLPATLTPRYIPGNTLLMDDRELRVGANSPWAWGEPTDQVPDANKITPHYIVNGLALSPTSATETTTTTTTDTPPLKSSLSHQMTIAIELNAGLPLAHIDSPYHDIVMHKQQQRHKITTRKPKVAMDRDFVLRWQPVTEQAPTAAAFTQRVPANPFPATDNGKQTGTAEKIEKLTAPQLASEKITPNSNTSEDYALLMLLPPQIEDPKLRLPREAVFIIDTSGSMQGNSIVQAKQSLQLALQRLQPHDRFNVIEFNSTHTMLFNQAQTATPVTCNRLINLLTASMPAVAPKWRQLLPRP